MRHIPLGLVCLLLAACSPVLPIGNNSGDVLPAEAQRVIDRATATAGAIATQNALATALGVSARESATAARGATLDALAGLQTESALSLTQAAGYAVATDTTQARTQAARDTQVWATPTAAAMRAGATAQAAENARRLAQAKNVGEFWRSLRFIVLALLVVGGLTVIAVVAFDRLSAIRIARLGQQAIIAREAFRVLPPGHWAEWAPGDGYSVYPLPGLLDEPATIIENAAATPDKAHAWRHAARLFAWWGERYGFGIRDIGPAGQNVVTDGAWRDLSKMFKGAGVLAEKTIPGKKGKTTDWADDWDYKRFADDLAHGRLVLPFPTDDDAPKVAFAVPTQHHN